MIAAMEDVDFDWAARLMERRRDVYEPFSPVFWRPARGMKDAHAQFMRGSASRAGAVALRTDRGFVLTVPDGGRCFIDDFAVDEDERWMTDGRELLLAAWELAQSPGQSLIRVVTARRDDAKRAMLAGLGLDVVGRWWVRALEASGPASTWGPVTVGGVDALIVPAPPVYDPGGPVCLLGDVDGGVAGAAALDAAALGAVLAIVQRERAPDEAPATEPELEAAGFHNPSAFYEGVPR